VSQSSTCPAHGTQSAACQQKAQRPKLTKFTSPLLLFVLTKVCSGLEVSGPSRVGRHILRRGPSILCANLVLAFS